MKRKIAQLNVYLDDSMRVSASGIEGKQEDGSMGFRLIMGTQDKDIHTREGFQTIMAHELGHFVSLLTKDSTHSPEAKLYHALSGDTSQVLPGERKAWKIAHEIKPDLDTKLQEKCLATYERDDMSDKLQFPWESTCEPIPSGLPGVCPDDPKPADNEAKLARLRAMYWKAEQAKLDHKAHVWE